MGDWATTDWDTAQDTTEVTATTCTERGLLTLLLTLLLTRRLTPTFSMAMDTPTMEVTMAITCMERGLPTLLLLLTLRLTPTSLWPLRLWLRLSLLWWILLGLNFFWSAKFDNDDLPNVLSQFFF